MKNNLIAVLIGISTSVVGGYVYSQLIKINFPFIYLAGAVLAIIALSILAYNLRGKFYLLFSSSIVGYFPKGQSQYVNKVTYEIVRAKRTTI